ncbi:MAG: radical SAM protein [Candidatus Aenigmatarchaeota archaeon]|nr:MAG: radical SAM protein [Candidatus Aenigmarchaeota archaeon]
MFVLTLTENCNNNCMFCYQTGKFFMNVEEAKSLISKTKNQGEKHINFFGGEPTIHPHFFSLVKYVKNQGLDFSLNSNLRLLSYENFAKIITEFDPIMIQASIHGHVAELHDMLTRTPGSFEQTIKGVKNLLKLGYSPERILINTVITRHNMEYLKYIANLILNEIGFPKTKFSFMEIDGKALENIEELLPRYGEAYPFLETATKEALKKNKRILVEKGPICFCPDMPNVSYVFEKHLLDPRFEKQPADKAKFMKVRSCSSCPSNQNCNGVHRNYTKLYSLDELKGKKTSKLRVIYKGGKIFNF